jgi:teichoic acid transport system ATP-binding protein
VSDTASIAAVETRPSPLTIVAERVDVTYKIYAEQQRSLRRLASGGRRDRQHRSIEAVKQISLAVHAGESVGVVGHNGSGKSTLLRAIGGLMPITAGTVMVRSVPVLLGVKAALHSDLSARTNVFLGGTALRVPKRVLRERFDEIVGFAGVEDFVDLPLRAFSSGMRARLQFAIATAVTPDILMIDEALSVGDAEFKERADQRIREMMAEAGTVIVVSHSMKAITDICDRAVWVDHGRLIADGPAEAVTELYTRHAAKRRGKK